jgi:hypothetical protein
MLFRKRKDISNSLQDFKSDIKLIFSVSFLTPSLQVRFCSDYINANLKEFLSITTCELSFCKTNLFEIITVKSFLVNPLQLSDQTLSIKVLVNEECTESFMFNISNNMPFDGWFEITI